MASFMTPAGERVEAHGAMAALFRRRGWIEGAPTNDGVVVTVPPGPKSTRAKLAEYANALGIDADGLTKAQLIEAIQGLS